jgi:transcriptional regulator with XRE-family HTH domain
LPRKPSFSEEDPAYYESLGRAIKVARTQQDLGRRTLAERSGVSYAYLSDIETGRGRPSSKALLAIAGALGRAPSELLQEAELYGAMQELSAPGTVEGASGPAAPGEARAWFHAQPAARPSRVSEEPAQLARTEWQRLARSRLAGRTADERAELHAIVDGLGDDDAQMLLQLARRLLRP